MTWQTKDGAGNFIVPGDICVRANRSGKCEYCVFVGGVWGSKASNGEYGRFITNDSQTSIKLRNILLAFDPMSDRRAVNNIKELTRRFYENGR